MGRLEVTVIGAQNLPVLQTFGKIDPYVVLKFEGQQCKTRVIDNETSPEWNDVFKFSVADENSSQLKFEVWNSNVMSDDFVGEYFLSLTGLVRGVPKEGTYLLQSCKSNAELQIRLLAVDFGELPPDNAPAPAAASQPPAPPQPGYQPQQPVYPPQQPGYPPQQPGYPPQQPGYPPQQPGYPPQQPGYPPQQPGYPPQQPGYPPQQPGYPPQQPGYVVPPGAPGQPSNVVHVHHVIQGAPPGHHHHHHHHHHQGY